MHKQATGTFLFLFVASDFKHLLTSTGRRQKLQGFSDWERHEKVQLTGVGNGNPLVELVVIRHSVKLAAQHLSERGLVARTGFGVTRAVALPLPRAVLAAKLRPVDDDIS